MKIALLVFVFFLYAYSPAFASVCGGSKPSSYLYSDIASIKYIRTHNVDGLNNLHQSDGEVLGLAGGPIGTRLEMTFETVPYQGSLYCLNSKKIEATFFAEPTIYIARNFDRGSCEYKAVLRHEMKHVNEQKKLFHEYIPRYKWHLSEIAQKLPRLEPVSIQNVDEQKKYIFNYIQTEMQKYQSEMLSVLAQRQQKIDTAEEYERVQNVCHRWDQKLDRE